MTSNLKQIIALLGKSKNEDKLITKFVEALQEELVPIGIGEFSVNQSTGHLIYTIK